MEFVTINGMQVPVYAKDAFAWTPESQFSYDGGDAYGKVSGVNPATWGYAGGEGGLWGFQNPNNWRIQDQGFDGRSATQDYIDMILKSGDKTGSQFRYSLQGDKWMPQYLGDTKYNTSYDPKNYLKGAGFVAGVAGAGLGLGAAFGGLGGAGGAASAAGSGGGLFGEGAGALGGLGGVEPIATSGFTAAQGGIGSLGSGWGTAGVVAGEGGAGALGGAGGMFSGIGDMWGSLPSGVRDSILKVAPDLLKGGVSTLIGRGGDRAARIADQNFRDSQIAQGGALRDAAGGYATGLTGLFDKYKGAYDPFYAQVNNGIATSNIDPVTGKVGFSLNAPYQQQRDALFGQAGNVMGQIGSADPRAFATERYNAAQALLAPQDELSKQGLFQDLYSKGGFGLTLNQPAAPGAAPGGGVTAGAGSVGVNPYLDTYLNAQNRRNAQMSYDALGQGESYLDRLIGRQQGLFSAGQGIDTAGSGVMRDAFGASNQFMGDRRTAAGFGYGSEREALQIPYQAEKDYINALFGANQRFMGNQAAADQVKQNSYWDVAQKLPWGDIWTGISGLFGSKQ